MAEAILPFRKSPAVLWDASSAKNHQAKLDALIGFARRTKDWPLLENAIDAKIEDQEEFVRWWHENVRSAGQGIVADRGQYSVEQAASVTAGLDDLKSRIRDWVRYIEMPNFPPAWLAV